MDGPDIRDFGIFHACSEQEVKDIVMSMYFPDSKGDAAKFIEGCISVTRVWRNRQTR